MNKRNFIFYFAGYLLNKFDVLGNVSSCRASNFL
jgi:hypothetical protein